MTWHAGSKASPRHIQQLAVERLRALVESSLEHRVGSAAAVLRAMQEAAIAGGRLPVQTHDLFPD
jgi:hypothetical protein